MFKISYDDNIDNLYKLYDFILNKVYNNIRPQMENEDHDFIRKTFHQIMEEL